MGESGPVARAIESPAISIIGVVADVAAVVVLLNSDSARSWLSRNTTVVIFALALLALTTVFLLNAWLASRSSQGRVNQDADRFSNFIQEFGHDTPLYKWLRQHFITGQARSRELDYIGNLTTKWQLDPTSYRDRRMAKAFAKLRVSVEELETQLIANYFAADRDDDSEKSWYRIPAEWKYQMPETHSEAINAIRSAHRAVLDAYTEFVQLAQRKGMASN